MAKCLYNYSHGNMARASRGKPSQATPTFILSLDLLPQILPSLAQRMCLLLLDIFGVLLCFLHYFQLSSQD